jgi:hypothetical protein
MQSPLDEVSEVVVAVEDVFRQTLKLLITFPWNGLFQQFHVLGLGMIEGVILSAGLAARGPAAFLP